MFRSAFTFIFVIIGVMSVNAQASGFIVHPKTPIDEISSQTIRLIYTLRYRQWSDNLGIKVFVLNDDSLAHKQFTKKELKLFSHHLRRIWDRALFSGLGQVPTPFKNEQELIDMVALTPGSIAFIFGDVPPNARVKQLNIRD